MHTRASAVVAGRERVVPNVKQVHCSSFRNISSIFFGR